MSWLVGEGKLKMVGLRMTHAFKVWGVPPCGA